MSARERLGRWWLVLALGVGAAVGTSGCILVPAPVPVLRPPVVVAPRPVVVVPGPYVYPRRWWW